MTAKAGRAGTAHRSKTLLAVFGDDLIALRDRSTSVARLRRPAIFIALRKLDRDPEREIARILDLMSQIENDFRRIRQTLISA